MRYIDAVEIVDEKDFEDRLNLIRRRRRFLFLNAIIAYLIYHYILCNSVLLGILRIFYLNHTEKILPRQEVKWLQNPPAIVEQPSLVSNLHDSKCTSNTAECIMEDETRSSKLDVPNFLFILADDLGYNDLSGHRGVSTPNIDSIAANGITFTNAYAGSATCAPSRASLLTGRYAAQTGWEFTLIPKCFSRFMAEHHGRPDTHPIPYFHEELYDQVPDMYDTMMPKSNPHMAQLLKKSYGYWNYYFGKWDSGHQKSSSPISFGYDESLAFHLGASLYLPPKDPRVTTFHGIPFDDFLTQMLMFKISHNNQPLFNPDEYMTDYLGNQTVSLLHELHQHSLRKGEILPPWHINLAFNAPHDPYQALLTDLEDPEIQKIDSKIGKIYGAMIKALDRNVGKVIQALKDTNQYENTIIIFTSDNGGAFYANFKDLNKPLRGWKATMFEGGIRVPLFMQWKAGLLPENLIVDTSVMHIDIIPTILTAPVYQKYAKRHQAKEKFEEDELQEDMIKDINGIMEDYKFLDGTSIWPKLLPREDNDNNDEKEDKNEAKANFDDVKQLKPWNEDRVLFWRSGHYMALRKGDMKLQISQRPFKIWLHNITADIHEDRNLAWTRLHIANEDELKKRIQLRADHQEYLYNNSPKNSTAPEMHQKVHYESIYYANEEDEALFTWLVDLYQQLKETNAQMRAPLWPALLELPICVDEASLEACRLDQEYVYWPN